MRVAQDIIVILTVSNGQVAAKKEEVKYEYQEDKKLISNNSYISYNSDRSHESLCSGTKYLACGKR